MSRITLRVRKRPQLLHFPIGDSAWLSYSGARGGRGIATDRDRATGKGWRISAQTSHWVADSAFTDIVDSTKLKQIFGEREAVIVWFSVTMPWSGKF
jgi:hypothetical protein